MTQILRAKQCVGPSMLAYQFLMITIGIVAMPAHAETSAAEVIAANHTAMKFPDRGAIDASYAFSGLGLTGTASRMIDAATGAYVENMSAGPISIGSGYDSKIPWMKDFSGAYTPQEGGDRVEIAVNQAYRFSNAWWRPEYGGASIAYAGRESTDGRETDHLRVVPKGGKVFDAWFDVASHLLTRVAEVQGFTATQTFYSDYVLSGGVRMAQSTVLDIGGGPPSYITLTLQEAAVRSNDALSEFARPVLPFTDATIDGGKRSATLTFRLLNNHIYVPVFVNGKGPFTFIVDTGGHLALSPHLAKELQSDSQGSAPAQGAGDKIATTGFTHVGEIALGPVRLRDQTAFVLEVYDTAVEGIPVDGMVGFELFRRFGVQIDYAARKLTIFEPTLVSTMDPGTAIPFNFYDHLPDVQGMIDGVPARFDIDTGSRSELDVTQPFAKRSSLDTMHRDAVDAVTGWGVGGPVRSRVIRLSSLMLGPVRVDNPVAELSASAHGSFSDSNYDGNIGSALLRRFVVTFDYSQQRMYLKPEPALDPDVGSFDKAGFWFNADAAGYLVTALDAGGPAAEAGLMEGDVITAIDGKEARAAELSDARLRLRTLPSGSVVHLDLLRQAGLKSVDIRLRDLIALRAR